MYILLSDFHRVIVSYSIYVYLQSILLFLMRQEPVLFLQSGVDKIPYSLREINNLHEQLTCKSMDPKETNDLEVEIRKLVII